jgi:predicted nicotinamide N-methyase
MRDVGMSEDVPSQRRIPCVGGGDVGVANEERIMAVSAMLAPQRQRPSAAELSAFVMRETRVERTALVPEIGLHLATSPRLIFQAADDLMDSRLGARPYWAFAWPGGQALARYLLDHPDLVAGRRVLDVGAGSGLSAIAAAMAGAGHVLATDTDPLAAVACAMNARANGVTVDVSTADVLAAPPSADVLLIGDLVYEPDLLIRVGAMIDAAVAAGTTVLYGDRTSARRPMRRDFKLIDERVAALTPALVDDFVERARVWRV